MCVSQSVSRGCVRSVRGGGGVDECCAVLCCVLLGWGRGIEGCEGWGGRRGSEAGELGGALDVGGWE